MSEIWWTPLNDNISRNKDKILPFGNLNKMGELILDSKTVEAWVTDEGFICNDKGPGSNIKVGEWYLTIPLGSMESIIQNKTIYLSYYESGNAIHWIQVGPMNNAYWQILPNGDMQKSLSHLSGVEWKGGGKDSWGNSYHYKVPMQSLKLWPFINWKVNPLIGGGA